MTTFQTASLALALSQVLAPTKKPSQGQHAFVLLRYTDASVAILESVNSSMRCSSLASGVEGDPIECLVHAEMLHGAIENGSGDHVTLEIVDGRLKLLRGSQKTMLPILPVTPENWTDDTNPKALARVSIESKELIHLLRAGAVITRSCAREELRMVELCNKGYMSICATNSTALVFGKLSAESTVEFCVNIPPEACQEVVTHCDSDLVVIKVLDNAIKFQCGEFSVRSVLIANARKITDQIKSTLSAIKEQCGDNWCEASGNRALISQAVYAADSIAKKKTRPSVRISVSEGKLQVDAENGDSATESIVECRTKNAGVFLTNGTQMAQLLNHCKGDELTIWKSNDHPPIIFGDDIENTKFVSMEVRE